jgi:hypothetical protein
MRIAASIWEVRVYHPDHGHPRAIIPSGIFHAEAQRIAERCVACSDLAYPAPARSNPRLTCAAI